MIQLLMMLSLAGLNPKATVSGDYQTCQWPNKCSAVQVAQVQTCQWPNKCAAKPAEVAQVQPCVWPNKCAARVETAVLAQVQTCQWPNKCAENADSSLQFN